jgi:hypothetical protein
MGQLQQQQELPIMDAFAGGFVLGVQQQGEWV